MDTSELSQLLFSEGCNPNLYTIGHGGSDAFCLYQSNGKWQVCYTERGHDSPPIFETDSEKEACQFFFRQITSFRHDHCVGLFRSEQCAIALEQRLLDKQIQSRRDKVPYGGPHDPRYRVFVSGKAIFGAKELLGSVPIRDEA